MTNMIATQVRYLIHQNHLEKMLFYTNTLLLNGQSVQQFSPRPTYAVIGLLATQRTGNLRQLLTNSDIVQLGQQDFQQVSQFQQQYHPRLSQFQLLDDATTTQITLKRHRYLIGINIGAAWMQKIKVNHQILTFDPHTINLIKPQNHHRLKYRTFKLEANTDKMV